MGGHPCGLELVLLRDQRGFALGSVPARTRPTRLAVEIGDWERLDGRRIGSYLGLVPTEHSSGQSRSQGGLTTHARRLLIEAAWHHRTHYTPTSPTLRTRSELASREARERAHQGNLRLHRRWRSFEARGKRRVVANAAVARELAGWCWSLAVMRS